MSYNKKQIEKIVGGSAIRINNPNGKGEFIWQSQNEIQNQQLLVEKILAVKDKVLTSAPDTYTLKMLEEDSETLSDFAYEYAGIEQLNILSSISDWFPELKNDKEIQLLETLALSSDQDEYENELDDYRNTISKGE